VTTASQKSDSEYRQQPNEFHCSASQHSEVDELRDLRERVERSEVENCILKHFFKKIEKSLYS
jgi:uncharacterized protein (UPF0335 family)